MADHGSDDPEILDITEDMIVVHNVARSRSALARLGLKFFGIEDDIVAATGVSQSISPKQTESAMVHK